MELQKPLGFDPIKEKSQWRLIYLECLACSIEEEDAIDARVVNFYKLLELLSNGRFKNFVQEPDGHLEYKEVLRRQALSQRLRQDDAVTKVAAHWRGHRTRYELPHNTTMLAAQRTLRGLLRAQPSGLRQRRSSAVASRSRVSFAAAEQNGGPSPRGAHISKGSKHVVDPIDGTIQHITDHEGKHAVPRDLRHRRQRHAAEAAAADDVPASARDSRHGVLAAGTPRNRSSTAKKTSSAVSVSSAAGASAAAPRFALRVAAAAPLPSSLRAAPTLSGMVDDDPSEGAPSIREGGLVDSGAGAGLLPVGRTSSPVEDAPPVAKSAASSREVMELW